MFRAYKKKRSVDKNEQPAAPSEMVLGKAEGFIFWCDQRALIFGSDRYPVPSDSRPVVSIMRDDLVHAIVLPCTRNPKTWDPMNFFKLEPEHILMRKEKQQKTQSFVYWRYETVPHSSVGKKIGMLSQEARIALFHWLRHRY